MNNKGKNGYIQTVKEKIDVLYEVTKGGYTGSISSFKDFTLSKVASELIKRGVIRKQRVEGTVGYHYDWVATSEPTPTFYKNVAEAIQKHQHEIDKARRENEKKDAAVTAKTKENGSLSDYTIQALWDELKKRGVQIEGDRLVVIEKTYLN